MADEFQESDIIFSDQLRLPEDNRNYFTHNSSSLRHKNKNIMSLSGSSSPLNIPGNISRFVESEDVVEMEFDDGDMTPPHLIVGRRIAGKMAFSVCTGNGRTLKGRDLSHVRNSILRLTGFLES